MRQRVRAFSSGAAPVRKSILSARSLILLLLLAPAAKAATNDWKSNATSVTWATGGNWSTGSAPVTTDIARFNQTSYLNQPTAGTTTIAGLVFGDGTTATAATTITITALTLGTSGINIFANAGAVTLTGGNINLNGTQIWSNNSSSTLTVASGVRTATAADSTLTVTGSGNTTISGIIANQTKLTSLTKEGTGTLRLTGVNTFTGGVTLNNGTLQVATSASALGAGALTLNGGTLDLAHNGALTFNRNTTVGGNTTIISEKITAGAGATYTFGTLAIGANTLTVQGGNVTSGTAGLTFGATTLNGNATFDISNPTGGGVTLLTAGAITGGANTLTLRGNGNFAQSDVWSGTGSGLTLDSTYTGNATLNKLNIFTGKTTIGGGTLTVGLASALSSGSDLIVNGGTLNVVTFANTVGAVTLGNGTITGTTGVL
ncbi:MAG: autotransporter-associated beta strand repeat-containing protein, partial [Verrucomicrobiota bacterium]